MDNNPLVLRAGDLRAVGEHRYARRTSRRALSLLGIWLLGLLLLVFVLPLAEGEPPPGSRDATYVAVSGEQLLLDSGRDYIIAEGQVFTRVDHDVPTSRLVIIPALGWLIAGVAFCFHHAWRMEVEGKDFCDCTGTSLVALPFEKEKLPEEET